jgi:hypothetical protein
MTRGSRTLHAEIPLHHVGPLIPVAFVAPGLDELNLWFVKLANEHYVVDG